MNRLATLHIRTPEGVVFSQELAGPMVRFLAWFIDVLCLLAFVFLLNMVLAIFAFISFGLAQAVGMLSFFLFYVGYGI